MEILKILFGLNQSSDNSIEERVLEMYRRKTDKDFEYKKEFDLVGIEKEITFNKYNILILNELLERQSTVTTDFLDDLTDKHPNLRVIFVIDSEKHEGDAYVKRLYNIGIHDIVYSHDLSIDILVDLIVKGRTKAEAKVYLDLVDTDDDVVKSELKYIPGEELDNILSYLSLVEKDLVIPTIRHVKSQYNEKQMLYLVNFLPEEIKEILKEDNEFLELVLRAEEIKIAERYEEKKGVLIGASNEETKEEKESIFSLDKRLDVKIVQKKETIVQNQIIGSVFIGVANSVRGAGSTFISMALANYIKSQGQSVAIIEMNPNPQLGNLVGDKAKNMIKINGIDIYYMKKRENDEFPVPPLSSNYKYIIADLGVLKKIEDGVYINHNNYFEFLRSTIPILMVSGHTWKWGEVFPYLLDDSFKNFTIYVGPSSSNAKKIIYKDLSGYTDKVYFLPFTEDPYNPSEELCKVFDDSLGEFVTLKKRKTKFSLPKIELPEFSFKKFLSKGDKNEI